MEWQIGHTEVLRELFKAREIDAMFIDSVVEGATYIKEVQQEKLFVPFQIIIRTKRR